MNELRRGDGDPIGVDQKKDTNEPEEKLSHTLGKQGSYPAPASRDAAEPIVERLWPDPSCSAADIAHLLGRSKFFVHELANDLGLERPKPFSVRARMFRAGNQSTAKFRAVKRDNLREEQEKAALKARDRMIADLYARHGGYTDDPRALPPQPFMPIGWEPRPVDERLQRSMTGCSAAMAVRN